MNRSAARMSLDDKRYDPFAIEGVRSSRSKPTSPKDSAEITELLEVGFNESGNGSVNPEQNSSDDLDEDGPARIKLPPDDSKRMILFLIIASIDGRRGLMVVYLVRKLIDDKIYNDCKFKEKELARRISGHLISLQDAGLIYASGKVHYYRYRLTPEAKQLLKKSNKYSDSALGIPEKGTKERMVYDRVTDGCHIACKAIIDDLADDLNFSSQTSTRASVANIVYKILEDLMKDGLIERDSASKHHKYTRVSMEVLEVRANTLKVPNKGTRSRLIYDKIPATGSINGSDLFDILIDDNEFNPESKLRPELNSKFYSTLSSLVTQKSVIRSGPKGNYRFARATVESQDEVDNVPNDEDVSTLDDEPVGKRLIEHETDWRSAVLEAFTWHKEDGRLELTREDVVDFIRFESSVWDASNVEYDEVEIKVGQAIAYLTVNDQLVTDDEECWSMED